MPIKKNLFTTLKYKRKNFQLKAGESNLKAKIIPEVQSHVQRCKLQSNRELLV